MKKIFLSIFTVIMLFLITVGVSLASGINNPFGGRITNAKATEIQNLESSGWTCVVPGSSIAINPVKPSYPRSYIIPASVTSKTGTTPRSGQWIIGLYGTKTTVSCTRACPPAVCTTTVTLDTINMYGTSKTLFSGFGGGNFGGGGAGSSW